MGKPARKREKPSAAFEAVVEEVKRDLDSYRPTTEQLLADLDDLTRRISAKWPEGLTAVEAVRQQRGP